MISRLAALLFAVLLSAGPALAEEQAPHPNAGFGNEVFFLRSDDDNFALAPGGRLQVDFLGFEGGAREPVNTFLVKRARIELLGTFLKRWDFQLGSEFTNPAPEATDNWVNANYTPYANVQVGQFDAPFTMENRTSDKWTDLLERSVVIRALGVPEGKELGGMVRSRLEKRWAYWSLGLFNGEGLNQPHRSNHFEVIGRATISPFWLAGVDLLKDVWVGGSFWEGNRAPSAANPLDRPAMKTQGGFTFFNPVAGAIHTGYFGQTTRWGLELNAPIGRVVVKSEYVHVSEGLREVNAGTGVRNATLSGGAFYARVSYFFWGDPLINGLGGAQTPPQLVGRLKPGRVETALQLILEYDRLGFTYASTDGSSSPFAGDYGLSVYALGLNYWCTRHVRLGGNFLYNVFEGAAARPLATSGHSYELELRVGLAL